MIEDVARDRDELEMSWHAMSREDFMSRMHMIMINVM